MTEKINADMIVKAFNEFSAVEFDREPMAVGKYFVVRTNADNIYRIDTAKVNEIHCCYDCEDGKDTRFDFTIEVYNRTKGFIMDFDCYVFTTGNLRVNNLCDLVFQWEGIDSLF